MGSAHDEYVGREAQLDVVLLAPVADLLGLVGGEVVEDHIIRSPSGRAARQDLMARRELSVPFLCRTTPHMVSSPTE